MVNPLSAGDSTSRPVSVCRDKSQPTDRGPQRVGMLGVVVPWLERSCSGPCNVFQENEEGRLTKKSPCQQYFHTDFLQWEATTMVANKKEYSRNTTPFLYIKVLLPIATFKVAMELHFPSFFMSQSIIDNNGPQGRCL